MNDGNFYVSKIGGSMNLNLLRNSLNFYLSPSITFYKSAGLYNRSSAPFNLYVSATYYLGNFYFQGYYQPAYRSMGKMTASADGAARDGTCSCQAPISSTGDTCPPPRICLFLL